MPPIQSKPSIELVAVGVGAVALVLAALSVVGLVGALIAAVWS